MDFARLCTRLDPRCFKAFLAVASEGSFSLAANRAAMTVSGVSQHIASIESAVGTPLFLRTTSGCRLTEQGHRFHTFIKSYSNLLADLMEDLTVAQNELQGVVRYAMPPSCVLSPHFPALLERRLAHPDLELSVALSPNAETVRSLLEGHLDFGFVTERVINPAVIYSMFCQEEYVLVGRDRRVIQSIAEDNFIHQRFVIYPGVDVYINFFVKHFFPALKNVDARSIHHVSGRITSIEGGIKMATGGLGVSVFPRHCVQPLIDAGQLYAYEQPGVAPLMNDIYIATAANVQQPRRVLAVIEWFHDMLHTMTH